MKNEFLSLILISISLALIYKEAAYNVNVDEVAIITQFGRMVGTPKEPGSHFKIPFIQKDHHYSIGRMHRWEGEESEVKIKDGKNIRVLPIVMWKISDPVQFYISVYSIESAASRLEDVLYSSIKASISRYDKTINDNHLRRTKDEVYLNPKINNDILKTSGPFLEEFGMQISAIKVRVR